MNLNTIPNGLIAFLGIGFYAYAIMTGMPGDQIIWHSQVCIVAFVLGVGAFVAGILSAGVAKLMAVAFLWLGVSSGFTFMAVSYSLTAAYGFAMQRMNKGDSAPYLPFAALAIVLMAAFGAFGDTKQAQAEIAVPSDTQR